MSQQNSFHHSFTESDLDDPIGEYKTADKWSAMDDKAFLKASDKPDQYLLNISLAEIKQGEFDYRASRMRVMEQMLNNGYTLESVGSYYDHELFFVHHTVLKDWSVRLYSDEQNLIRDQLVVKF